VTTRLITDMNDRERARFIVTLKSIRDNAASMIEALEEQDDSKLIVPALIFTASIGGLNDLFAALAGAQQVDTSDLDRPMPEAP
jgi:hypothetical protein